jgi:hypothetical protein
MQLWTRSVEHPSDFVGQRVHATKKIHQSPRSREPDISRGTKGTIQDYLGPEDSFMVEFKVGRIWTVVECYWDEITLD